MRKPSFNLGSFLMLVPLAAVFLKPKKPTTSQPLAAGEKTPMQRIAEALASNDIETIRELSAQLRKEGETELADRLDQGIAEWERIQARGGFDSLPGGVDAVTEPELLSPNATPSQDERIVEAWLRASDKGAPALTSADLKPEKGAKRRKLTAHERWVLDPYFPVKDDLSNTFLVFEPMPGGAAIDGLWAITATEGPGKPPVIYLPHGRRSMLSRFWMCLLGHELIHVSQYRVGLLNAEASKALLTYGYTNSPVEIQARYFQRLIFADITRRAREYFTARGIDPNTL